jgi:hypothetical protein
MANDDTKLRVSPFCTHVRTKKTYFLDAPAMTEDDVMDGSGRVWCRLTMQSVGPDGELVLPDDCRSHRDCFESSAPKA